MLSLAITSDHPRHRSFLKSLCEKVDISCAFIEYKPNISETFAEKERAFFNDIDDWRIPCETIYCKKGRINKPEIIDTIKKLKPDFIFVFGSSLLSEEIFSCPKRGCINIHTGLVQYHRGVDSCYWAIYEERPETIGVTVHYIDSSIDGGDVLCKNVENILKNKVKSYKLQNRGRLYQSKDMTEDKRKEIKNKTKEVLKKYLKGSEPYWIFEYL